MAKTEFDKLIDRVARKLQGHNAKQAAEDARDHPEAVKHEREWLRRELEKVPAVLKSSKRSHRRGY